jgi:hypothetical protein
VFRSYRLYSLKSEKRLKELTENRIESRGGEILPIEKRILASIAKTFEASRLSPEEVIPGKLKNWGGKNIYQKAGVRTGGCIRRRFWTSVSQCSWQLARSIGIPPRLRQDQFQA